MSEGEFDSFNEAYTAGWDAGWSAGFRAGYEMGEKHAVEKQDALNTER